MRRFLYFIILWGLGTTAHAQHVFKGTSLSKALIELDQSFLLLPNLETIEECYWDRSYWASLVTQLVKNPSAMWETRVQSLGWEDPLEKERLPTPVFWPEELQAEFYAVHEIPKSWTQLSDFYTSLVTFRM